MIILGPQDRGLGMGVGWQVICRQRLFPLIPGLGHTAVPYHCAAIGPKGKWSMVQTAEPSSRGAESRCGQIAGLLSLTVLAHERGDVATIAIVAARYSTELGATDMDTRDSFGFDQAIYAVEQNGQAGDILRTQAAGIEWGVFPVPGSPLPPSRRI